jgi:hypothetical protein
MPPSEFIIYDYKDFTSRLADFKRFCSKLGDFGEDTTVPVFDTHSGMQRRNLGTLLHHYNSTCNEDGIFSIHRIFGVGPFADGIMVHHRVAGMLGVFGNIVGSTALHGIVALNVCGSEDQTNNIGDDAGMAYCSDDLSFDEVKNAIRTIGEIAEEKFERWTVGQESVDEHDGWHYTKRPIGVEDGTIYVGWLPEFPVLARVFGVKDGQHTVPSETFEQRRRLMIKQTGRFLNSLTLHQAALTEQDIAISLDILRKAYHRMNLDPSGSYPTRYPRTTSHSYPDSILATPPLTEDSIVLGWWSALRLHEPATIINVPVDEGATEVPEKWSIGMEFVTASSRILGLMEKIRVLDKTPLTESLLVNEEVLERYEDFVMRRRQPLYKYQVLKDYEHYQSYAEFMITK